MSVEFLKAPLLAIVFTALAGLYAPGTQAEVDDLDKKLQQCEALFKKAHSPDVSQREARESEAAHLKLMVEILTEMNNRNAAQENLSEQEVQDNLRVMGRLLELLARSHVPEPDKRSYLY